jgi:hypothetical protein
MNFRDLIRSALPSSITDTIAYDVGAIIGDDARAHGLSWLTMFACGALPALAQAIVLQLDWLASLGVSPRARREVAGILADAIRRAGGGPVGVN